MASDVKIDLKFPEITAAIEKAADAGVRNIAFAVQEAAQLQIQDQDIIDTGSLFNSIFVDADGYFGRDEAMSKAIEAGHTIGKHSGKTGNPQEAGPGTQAEPLVAVCGACVEHGRYVEEGITGVAHVDGEKFGQEGMYARPFMAPAAEEVRPKAEQIMAEHIKEVTG